jgi:hypothetical protein
LQNFSLRIHLFVFVIAKREDPTVEDYLTHNDTERKDVLLLTVAQVVGPVEGVFEKAKVDLGSNVGEGEPGDVVWMRGGLLAGQN